MGGQNVVDGNGLRAGVSGRMDKGMAILGGEMEFVCPAGHGTGGRRTSKIGDWTLKTWFLLAGLSGRTWLDMGRTYMEVFRNKLLTFGKRHVRGEWADTDRRTDREEWR